MPETWSTPLVTLQGGLDCAEGSLVVPVSPPLPQLVLGPGVGPGVGVGPLPLPQQQLYFLFSSLLLSSFP